MSFDEKKKELTRRDFVKGVTAGAVGGLVAGTAGTAFSAPKPKPNTWLPAKWDYEADVVVVGLGGAGSAAAIAAHDAGAKVLILEKMPEPLAGGATAINSGVLGMKGLFGTGLIGNIDRLREETFGEIDEEYANVWSNGLKDLIVWLEGFGVAMKGTNMLSVSSQGDYTPSQVLYAALKNQVNRRGIRILYKTPGRELIQDSGTNEILGVKADSGGKAISVKAKKAVILTNGDYSGNLKMLHDFNNPGLYIASRNSPANTGDGHKMGMKAGATLWHMAMGLEWTNWAFKVPSQLLNTAVTCTMKSQSYLFVNRFGKRFMGEQRPMAHYKGQLEVLDFKLNEPPYPHIPFFIVFDEKLRTAGPLVVAERFMHPSLGVIDPNGWYALRKVYNWSADNTAEIAKGWIVKADTIQELAAKMTAATVFGKKVSVDPAGLADTVNKYNEYCSAGKDTEFARPKILPLDTPPYYAAELCLQTAYTIGGLKHNAKSQTVTENNKPIPRLYSAGDVGQVSVVTPDGMSGAMVFGRIAGKNAAAEKPWK